MSASTSIECPSCAPWHGAHHGIPARMAG